MSQPVIELNQVSKWYQSDPSRKVLDHINLKVKKGEQFAIVGSSGCGKSTLLNLIGTLDSPSEGSISINGRAITGLPENDLAALRSQEIGFIFQLHHLLPQCSALENVLVPTLALPNRPDSAAVNQRARDLFKEVGLQDKLDSKPSQLSGGERQRVAVIRALINQPKILLADEPTGALDEENAENLINLLVKLNQAEELALIVVTHNRDLAKLLGDVRTLKGGKLEALP